MKTVILSILTLLLAVVAACAEAQTYRKTPENGFWWNPSEPGRGWSIESQGETVAILHYVYDTQGRATFLQSAGTWDSTNRVLSTRLFDSQNGQCVGCPYREPASADLGAIRFEFSGDFAGRVIYPNGTSIPIVRFTFGFADEVDFVLGSWSTAWTSVSGILSEAHFIYLARRCTTAGCPPNTAEGSLRRSRSGRIVLVANSSPNIYIAVIDASTTFFDYYYFIGGSEKWSGVACTGRKGDPTPPIAQCTGLIDGVRSYTLTHSRRLFGSPLKLGGTDSVDARADDIRERILADQKSAALTGEALERVEQILAQSADVEQAAEALRRQALEAIESVD